KLKNLLLSILSLSLASLMFGLYVHPYGLALTGLMMSPFYPLMMSFIGSEFPRTLNKALALAVAFSSLFVVIMHTSVGWLTEQYGIRHALLAGPAFCLLPWGMLILYEKIFRRVPAPV
ncbi:MAG: MFS transporter, partial [Bdellovibrio sp. CG10_big_fil_rev_8_21_14_0_10_47_8]